MNSRFWGLWHGAWGGQRSAKDPWQSQGHYTLRARCFVYVLMQPPPSYLEAANASATPDRFVAGRSSSFWSRLKGRWRKASEDSHPATSCDFLDTSNAEEKIDFFSELSEAVQNFQAPANAADEIEEADSAMFSGKKLRHHMTKASRAIKGAAESSSRKLLGAAESSSRKLFSGIPTASIKSAAKSTRALFGGRSAGASGSASRPSHAPPVRTLSAVGESFDFVVPLFEGGGGGGGWGASFDFVVPLPADGSGDGGGCDAKRALEIEDLDPLDRLVSREILQIAFSSLGFRRFPAIKRIFFPSLCRSS